MKPIVYVYLALATAAVVVWRLGHLSLVDGALSLVAIVVLRNGAFYLDLWVASFFEFFRGLWHAIRS